MNPHTYETTWYTSRRLSMPADRAAAALDQRSTHRDRMEFRHDHIRLSAVTTPVAIGPGAGPVRRLRGRLHPGGISGPLDGPLANPLVQALIVRLTCENGDRWISPDTGVSR